MSDSKIHLEVIHEGPHCISCEFMAKMVESVAPEFGHLLRWEKVIVTRKEGACRWEDLAKTGPVSTCAFYYYQRETGF